MVWICARINPSVLFATRVAAQRLSNAVIISLIQQLSFLININSSSASAAGSTTGEWDHEQKEQAALKLTWIKEALMAMDSLDATIAQHVPAVMADLVANVDAFCDTYAEQAHVQPTDSLLSLAKVVKHLARPLAASPSAQASSSGSAGNAKPKTAAGGAPATAGRR